MPSHSSVIGEPAIASHIAALLLSHR